MISFVVIHHLIIHLFDMNIDKVFTVTCHIPEDESYLGTVLFEGKVNVTQSLLEENVE